MRDFMFCIGQLTDTERATLARLLNCEPEFERWRHFEARSFDEKVEFAKMLGLRLAVAAPRAYRSPEPLPLLYAQALEVADHLLGLGPPYTEAPDSIELGNSIIGRVLGEVLAGKGPAEREAFIAAVDDAIRKVHPEWGSATIGSIPAAAFVAGNLGGFATYTLASTLVSTLAGAIGLTLPFAAYMGMSSAIAAFLGPLGWVIGGVAGVAGVSRARSAMLDRRDRIRFLAATTQLIAIDQRVRSEIQPLAVPKADQFVSDVLDELDSAFERIADLESRLGANDGELAGLQALNDLLREQVARKDGIITELQQQVQPGPYPLRDGRVCPIETNGDHTSVWSNSVACIGDVPEPARALFRALMRHCGVRAIRLGQYHAGSRSSVPPRLVLQRRPHGGLEGYLHTKGKRAHRVAIFVDVEPGSEQSVILYAAAHGLLG